MMTEIPILHSLDILKAPRPLSFPSHTGENLEMRAGLNPLHQVPTPLA
ncbi:hypothetical protein Krac_2718 [Ktedonobacter racemifer DSM 44963]|uniref:Uncharacterized protein n=1 Tax=Ktedonobacter racemifer DSM 44963 TaxID=485913 RepID=D6TZG4_KTERA|nr:hypothetical protein Krac_2718 [Ktedonobacter racemifer DSM 44963]